MELSYHTNHLGFGQYRNEAGQDVCPVTLLHYTNEGEGVISPFGDITE